MKTVNVNFDYNGGAHSAVVRYLDTSWTKGHVSYDGKDVSVETIDNRTCLDVMLNDGSSYFAMCALAKAAAKQHLGWTH